MDSPRLIPGYITNIGLTFPIDPFRRANGAMEIWPRSFDLTISPEIALFDREKVVLDDLNPGDALCFNSRCWHQSGVNTTEEWRRAVTINICRAYMRQQFDYPRMMPPELVEGLGEDVKQFLGYHVRVPVSFEEFLAPPHLRPYRPGQE